MPHDKSSGLICKLPYDGCDGVYVGETMRMLENGLAQYKRDVSQKCKNAILRGHTTVTGHQFVFEKASIVSFENS